MDYRVARLRTPAECAIFAKNATALHHPELALAAQRKAVELQAATHAGSSPLEADCFAAVYAYEALLTRRNGKRTRATAVWQAIKRYGTIEAIERIVCRPPDESSTLTLHDLGLADLAFEALVIRHEASFGAAAIEVSKARQAALPETSDLRGSAAVARGG
jgi:hypothetical protein